MQCSRRAGTQKACSGLHSENQHSPSSSYRGFMRDPGGRGWYHGKRRMQIDFTCGKRIVFDFNKEIASRKVRQGLFKTAFALLFLVVSGLVSMGRAAPREERNATLPVDFNRDVRPILSDRCFHCHGPDSATREADLRLDLEENAKADLGGYAAVVAGDPDVSELIRRIRSEDESELMPPADSHKELSPEEIELLVRWVREGAVWSLPWAYVPPIRHIPPAPSRAEGAKNWIDRFIVARLAQERLQPSPTADRVTLVRRLSFDLTGLSPLPEEVDRFVEDERPDAYQRLIDRLLASPHFGERMAIYWLDLVRFADTVGYHGDQTHNIWPYRDYVIRAFNENKPLDVFTHEQLAGDLLDKSSLDQRIASGYNRLLQTTHEGGLQLKEYRAIYLADRVRNVSQVWLGATMGCAQCHDHKYDPISTQDFYSMGAFFADLDDEMHLNRKGNKKFDSLPTPRDPEIEVLGAYQRLRLSQLQDELAKLDPALADERVIELTAAIKKISSQKTLTMISGSAVPRQVRILPRGNWMDESGPLVEPTVPSFLGKIEASDGQRATRLDLARWLTNTEKGVGGLTARVMVNRLWYLMFGRGIAPVLDDFGGQGEPPEYPELLDNLAVEFVESGWDVKHMLRLIATSQAYRQSSVASPELIQHDPYNRLVARQSQFRISAEMVRDTALRVGGLLETDLGGPSVKPYQPTGHYRNLNFPKRKYTHDTNRQQWRRGLYVHWQRQFLHPMMKAFDAPGREECTAQRPRSNTALAALTLLNDPTFVESARAFAAGLLAETGDFDSRLAQAFRQAMSRLPSETERQMFHDVYQTHHRYYRSHPDDAQQLLEVGMHEISGELGAVELASWTGVTRILLNLSETTTRN